MFRLGFPAGFFNAIFQEIRAAYRTVPVTVGFTNKERSGL